LEFLQENQNYTDIPTHPASLTSPRDSTPKANESLGSVNYSQSNMVPKILQRMETRLRSSLTPMQHSGVQKAVGSSRVTGRRVLVPILLLVITALAGGVLIAQSLMSNQSEPTPATIETMGDVDGLWFTVQSVVWVGQDRLTNQRVPVATGSNPASKPHGLQVEIKVQNRADGTRILGPQDFRLQAKNGTTSAPTGRAFPLTILGPRQYLHSVLSFDVPESSLGMQLVWSRAGHEVRVLVKAPVPDLENARADGREVSSCLPTMEIRCADGSRPSTSRTGGN
jgi:hypothetical protein